DWLYELAWQESAAPAATTDLSGRWLIVGDQGGLAQALSQRLQAAGAEVTVAGDEICEPDDYRALLARLAPTGGNGEANHALRGVVYLRGLDSAGVDPSCELLMASQQRTLGGLLHLVQALAAHRAATPPRLYVATRGAVAVSATEPAAQFNVAASPLWGLARVVALEQAELKPLRIDLDPAADAAANIESLLFELRSADREDQFAYRQGKRYAARLVRYRGDIQSQATAGSEGDVRLEIPQRG